MSAVAKDWPIPMNSPGPRPGPPNLLTKPPVESNCNTEFAPASEIRNEPLGPRDKPTGKLT